MKAWKDPDSTLSPSLHSRRKPWPRTRGGGGRIWGRKRGTGAEVNNKGVPLGEVGGDRDGEATWETQGLD